MAGLTPAQGRQLLESGDHSDFLITCQGREIKVHKNLLASVSDFFRLLFKHDFKENSEAKVDFPDDEYGTIYRLCEFIYTGSYSSTAPACSEPYVLLSAATDQVQKSENRHDYHPGSEPELSVEQIHALVYCCAHEYDVPVLKDYAYSHFVDTTNVSGLPWEANVAALVYENTERSDMGLRNFVTRTCIDNYTLVEKDDKMVEVIKEHEPLMWEIGRSLKLEVKKVEEKVALSAKDANKLRVSFKEEEIKADRLRIDLDVANRRAARKLAESEKETATARAEIAREVAVAKRMFEHLRGAMFCEHCGKDDRLAAPTRQFNQETGQDQYLLKCNACGWWWWFNRD